MLLLSVIFVTVMRKVTSTPSEDHQLTQQHPEKALVNKLRRHRTSPQDFREDKLVIEKDSKSATVAACQLQNRHSLVNLHC